MKNRTRTIAEVAVIAALYVVLTFMVAPIARGPVQFRISEALMIVPALLASGVPGITLGVLLSNIFLGGGMIDIVFGTLATLLAAIGTRLIAKRMKLTPHTAEINGARQLWKKPGTYALPLPAIIFNALIVGAYVGILFPEPAWEGLAPQTVIAYSMLSIGLSEAVVVYILGLPLFVGLFNFFRNKR